MATINLEQLGSDATAAINATLASLVSIVQNDKLSAQERVVAAKEIHEISDDIAKWDMISEAVRDAGDDRKKLIDKLDKLG